MNHYSLSEYSHLLDIAIYAQQELTLLSKFSVKIDAINGNFVT